MKTILLTASALALVACTGTPEVTSAPPPLEAESADATAEDARLVAFLDEAWEEEVARSPEYQAYLGRRTNQDRWDDRSFAAQDEQRALQERQLAELRDRFERDDLSVEGKLNYDLFEYTLQNDLRLDDFRIQRFNLSQFRGVHSNIPVFLANYHAISSVAEAENYIARVEATPTVLDQAAAQMEARIEAGYPLPAFSYPLIEEGARGVMEGGPIRDDFQKKLDELETDEATKARLRAELDAAIETALKPAYDDFASRVAALAEAEVVDGDFGVGVREGGRGVLRRAAFQLHDDRDDGRRGPRARPLRGRPHPGRDARASWRRSASMETYKQFFSFMRESDRFYYDNTPEDRRGIPSGRSRLHRGDARQAQRPLHHPARGTSRGPPGRALPRAGGGQGVLQPARRGGDAAWHLLREPR